MQHRIYLLLVLLLGFLLILPSCTSHKRPDTELLETGLIDDPPYTHDASPPEKSPSYAQEVYPPKDYLPYDYFPYWRQRGVFCGFGAWESFRQELDRFFYDVETMQAPWIFFDERWVALSVDEASVQSDVLSWITAYVSTAKLIDPALYHDIVQAMVPMEPALDGSVQAFILYQAQQMYFVTQEWREEYIYRMSDFTVDDVPLWFDDIDWHCPSHQYGSELNSTNAFTHGRHTLEVFDQNREIGLLMMMYAMHYGVSGVSLTCPVWFLAMAEDDTRVVAMGMLIDRIATMQEGGIAIYRDYITLLSDERSVIDPRTQETFAMVQQALNERGLLR